MNRRLDDWEQQIPPTEAEAPYLHHICRLRGLELKMALLRPVPAIPHPNPDALRTCYEAARQSLLVLNDLYKANMLLHSWDVFYSVTLTIITLLYCAKAVPGLGPTQTLSDDLETGLRVLGAAGEHWTGAKRCRDILEELGRAMVASLRDQPSGSLMSPRAQIPTPNMSQMVQSDDGTLINAETVCGGMMNLSGGLFDAFGADGLLGDQFGFGEPTDDMETIMRNLFDDFIPTNPAF